MIYNKIESKEDIRQGDIFSNIPIPYLTNIDKLKILTKEGQLFETNWIDVDNKNEILCAKTESGFGVVISQNCDCLRGDELSLFRIQISSKLENKKSPKSIMVEILKINNSNYLMYLPKDLEGVFPNKMEINFNSIISIKRQNLEKLKKFRAFRLNDESLEHFRNKVNNYFLRYSLTESYPFNKEEFENYREKRLKDNPEEKFDSRDYQQFPQ